MQTSEYGLQFIGGWEGLRNQMYDDGGPGIGNCTIGIGHLIHYGPIDGRPEEAPFVNGLTDEECYALLRQDIPRYENVVNAHAIIALNQNQYDAMVDFCYNTGGGYPQVWQAVNTGGDVCAVLVRTAITPAWATNALVRRRKAECDLYNTPYAEPVPAPIEEEDDMPNPLVVWNTDLKTVQLVKWVGPAITIGGQPEVDALEAKYGKQIALSNSTITQMQP